MKTRKTIRIVLVLAVALAGASAAHAFDIITTPYNGADLLHMVTANNGVASNNYPGYTAGIFTAGAGTVADPAGMSYLIQDGDGGPVKMVDGVFDGDKYFSGGMSNPTSVPMGDLTGAANPTQTSGWKWFDAHFTSAVAITHFVYRTADHAWDRTPDQFQLRGSNDGGTTWDVIYRLDSNGGNGTVLPWGTVGSDTPPNFTAVQFNSGVDFAAPAAYKEIRLEVFSVCNGDGAGITEWQLAGSANVAAANFTATPGSGPLAFGNVPVSTISSAQTVTLNNVGDAAGTVSAATVTGAFAFADPLPGTPTYSVAASGAAVYNIVLPAQTLPGSYAGVATFTTSTGVFTYDLTATVFAHAGDVNGDGQVSLLDYNVIKANFGAAYETGNHWGDGDVNGDLQVGLLDFNIVKAHFGHTTGDGSAVTAVPEPATLSLLALAGLAALRRKR